MQIEFLRWIMDVNPKGSHRRWQCPHAGNGVKETEARNAGCQPMLEKGRDGFSHPDSLGSTTWQHCYRVIGESFALSREKL